MSDTTVKRPATLGKLSLVALTASIFIGVFGTASILSRTSEMGSWGALMGIAYGFMASSISLVLAVIGLARGEQPIWPAALGFFLSVLPGIYGFSLLWQLI